MIKKTKQKQNNKTIYPELKQWPQALRLYKQFHSISHKPLHYRWLTVVQKKVYNNARWQRNKKWNCLVGQRGVGQWDWSPFIMAMVQPWFPFGQPLGCLLLALYYTSCTKVLSLCHSMKYDLGALLDQETGFAPMLWQICQDQWVHTIEHSFHGTYFIVVCNRLSELEENCDKQGHPEELATSKMEAVISWKFLIWIFFWLSNHYYKSTYD